jgi:hypothetical protein
VLVKIWLLSYRGSAKKITGPMHCYVLTQTHFWQRGHAKVPSATSEACQRKFTTHLSSPHSPQPHPIPLVKKNTRVRSPTATVATGALLPQKAPRLQESPPLLPPQEAPPPLLIPGRSPTSTNMDAYFHSLVYLDHH